MTRQFVVVDKTDLKTKYDQVAAENLDENVYTEESWTALDNAMKKAEEVLGNKNATQDEVNTALTALEKARTDLTRKPVDKSKLEAKYDEITAENLNGAEYTEASWTALDTAMKKAEEVLDNPAVTQAEIDAALTELNNARVGLVNKAALQAKYDEITAESLNAADYTEASWTAFDTAKKKAEEVLGNPNATQAEINTALAELDQARTDLVNKAALQAKYDDITAESLNAADYTEASWIAFDAAMKKAEEVLGNPNASQAEIDTALADLDQARTDLVNKAALQAKYDGITAESLNAADYTEASWTVFDTAMKKAEEVLGNSAATQAEIDTALAELDRARTDLVNKAALQAKYDEITAESLNVADYTEASWTAFDTAMKKAEEVLGNPAATQAEVDAALTALEKARAELTKPVDKTALQTKHGEITAENLNAAEYTEASWTALDDAMNKAQEVLDNPAATQAEVDAALTALEKARTELTKKPVDKTALQTKHGEITAENLNAAEYTEASWTALDEAMNKAQEVLDNPTATQAEVDAALTALEKARTELTKKPVVTVDKTKLQGKHDEITAENLNAAEYTEASWTSLDNALTKAKEVLDNPAATQTEVNEALTALEKARTELTKKPVVTVDKTKLQGKHDEITAENLNAAEYTEASWTSLDNALTKAQEVLDNPSATQAEVDAALTALEKARTELAKKPVVTVDKTKLQGKHDQITAEKLSKANYTTASWQALEKAMEAAKAILDNPAATQAEVDAALDTLTKARNGLTRVSVPSGPISTGDNKQTITVDVISGDPDSITKVELERTTHADGRITDQVTFNAGKAQEAADKAIDRSESVVRILIPDANDEVSEVKVDVPQEAVSILKSNKVDLEIYTAHGKVTVPASSLEGLNESFYFRLVPVRKPQERQEIENRAQTEQVVRELSGNNQATVISRPMTIETNLSSRPVTLELPMLDVKLPSNAAEREAFLKELGVYIEHSDGEKEVVTGKVVTMDNGALGLRFSISKFSNFTIIHLGQAAADGHHTAYIKGYTDGTFRPDNNVTRAEMAAMLSRLAELGTSTDKAAFPDVAQKHWASSIIKLVNDAGLMQGYQDGSFRPEGNITRAEMAAIVFNYLELNKKTAGASYPDVSSTHWADSIIKAVQETGIMSGYPDGTFQPDKKLTRAEAVTILNRLFNRGPLYGVQTPNWPDVAASHWAYRDIVEAALDHSFKSREEGGEEWIDAE